MSEDVWRILYFDACPVYVGKRRSVGRAPRPGLAGRAEGPTVEMCIPCVSWGHEASTVPSGMREKRVPADCYSDYKKRSCP